jgi:uncharacterized protein
MTMEEPAGYRFQWKDLGDITLGRPNLGDTTKVAVYRLMQYTLRDVLSTRYGHETASDILREAGKLAGTEFCKNSLNRKLDFNGFVAELQDQLRMLNVGILRVEKADLENLELVMTVSEDLDCSGLPVFDETVCEYDEGFIAGVLQVYTGKEFHVREVDCWASGERTCRFVAKPVQERSR